ncbi:unnamed protein product [Bursaphelenchus xylophilus]|uniref:(pine wood nematode) hypothetical protein n=1 Tax=Bursaphelenchus xylophilus TaxID=6326 RepID=A0A1I7SKY6_BURXY|nr:unnamed protein product [Bursaphelenchus xylophilus]CAG9129301.1 unnamed protein product [Bursaphelenchus xylophilus]
MLKNTLRAAKSVEQLSTRLAHGKPTSRKIPDSAPSELREAFSHFFDPVEKVAAPTGKGGHRLVAHVAPSPVYEGVARKLGYRHKNGFQEL